MEENELYDRIGEADLNPTYRDGQTYQHTDVNNQVSIIKTAVNANYYDIQKIQNGDKNVGNSEKLDGAVISRYIDEELQADDDKIPSSQQAKAYMDALFSEYVPPIKGENYWTDEDKEQIVNEASSMVIENVTDDINSQVNKAKEDIESVAFTSFDVIDGKLIAYYSASDRPYDFRLNGNKLEVVMTSE